MGAPDGSRIIHYRRLPVKSSGMFYRFRALPGRRSQGFP